MSIFNGLVHFTWGFKCNLPKNKAVNLGAKDLLINLQHKQSKENYEQYIVCKQQKHDVKTLLKHEKSTNIDEDIISKIKNSNTAKAIKELVKTISDTFYSASSTNYIKDLSNTIFEYIFYLCNIENLDKYEFFDYFSEKLLAKQKRRSERLDKTENKHVMEDLAYMLDPLFLALHYHSNTLYSL
ncbi:MAG: hypothetical protein IJ004_00560 [Clostridia bacterium]|nr:hypothetical protein [Clostridia bacterium]